MTDAEGVEVVYLEPTALVERYELDPPPIRWSGGLATAKQPSEVAYPPPTG